MKNLCTYVTYHILVKLEKKNRRGEEMKIIIDKVY